MPSLTRFASLDIDSCSFMIIYYSLLQWKEQLIEKCVWMSIEIVSRRMDCSVPARTNASRRTDVMTKAAARATVLQFCICFLKKLSKITNDIYIYIYIYIHMCVCIYICIYICIYYIYIRNRETDPSYQAETCLADWILRTCGGVEILQACHF